MEVRFNAHKRPIEGHTPGDAKDKTRVSISDLGSFNSPIW
jgi:hypothetical protein